MTTEWSVPRAWPGETVFILGGGPSLEGQGTERLEHRRTIAINSSIFDAEGRLVRPWPDYLFGADGRWLKKHRAVLERDWRDRVVTITKQVDWPGLLRLRKFEPPVKGKPGGVAISADPRGVAIRRTSLQGAMNLAMLLGATRLVLLGADGGPDANGRTHHHQPHEWAHKPGCWDEQLRDLQTMVKPLEDLGVEVLNASPGSHWDLWPLTTLDEVLKAS